MQPWLKAILRLAEVSEQRREPEPFLALPHWHPELAGIGFMAHPIR